VAWLHIVVMKRDSGWALPCSLEFEQPPADLTLLAGAAWLERLVVASVSGVAPAALMQLGTKDSRAFDAHTRSDRMPLDGATAYASDAFVSPACLPCST
jgi:hypothetical protein